MTNKISIGRLALSVVVGFLIGLLLFTSFDLSKVDWIIIRRSFLLAAILGGIQFIRSTYNQRKS